MWIANRRLKVVPPGATKAVLLAPGDEVPGFDDWGEVPKRAHINMDWVRKGDNPVKKAATKTITETVKVGDVSKSTTTVVPSGVAQVPSPNAVEFKCEKCAKAFKSAKAVKTHTTLAHKAA